MGNSTTNFAWAGRHRGTQSQKPQNDGGPMQQRDQAREGSPGEATPFEGNKKTSLSVYICVSLLRVGPSKMLLTALIVPLGGR